LAVVLGVKLQHSTTSPSPDNVRRYQTARGEYATIHMPDQSLLTLAPATTVSLTGRDVTVTGEAYFRIARNSTRPFTVRTANAVVRVLGTSFTVRHYAADRESRVVVEDGKISLGTLRGDVPQNQPTVLTARMMGRVTDSTVAIRTGVAVDDYIAWTRGRLIFDNIPLADVVTELARAYASEIRIADTTLAKEPVSMAASVKTDSITVVLDFLTRSINAHVKRVGNTYVIAPGRSTGRIPPAFHSLSPEKEYGR
jgi:ferric-dicitrate binding protein FerR (iron transport regulator)